MDLIIRNARLLDEIDLKHIGIEGGRIVEISDETRHGAMKEIDAHGKLTSAGFIEAHMHLDKALIPEPVNINGSLTEAVRIANIVKKRFTIEDVKKRARQVADMAIKNGTTALRTQVDVDLEAKLIGMRALLELKKEYAGKLDIQVVASPENGITNVDDTEKLLKQSLEMGSRLNRRRPRLRNRPRPSKPYRYGL